MKNLNKILLITGILMLSKLFLYVLYNYDYNIIRDKLSELHIFNIVNLIILTIIISTTIFILKNKSKRDLYIIELILYNMITISIVLMLYIPYKIIIFTNFKSLETIMILLALSIFLFVNLKSFNKLKSYKKYKNKFYNV